MSIKNKRIGIKIYLLLKNNISLKMIDMKNNKYHLSIMSI